MANTCACGTDHAAEAGGALTPPAALGRRRMLRGLAGAALVLPWLGAQNAQAKHAKPAAVAEEKHSEPKAEPGASKGGGHGEWTYEGEKGPENWGNLKPEYASCGAGKNQAPIDLTDMTEAELAPVDLEYQDAAMTVVNNGHTIQANMAPGNVLRMGRRVFNLLQFHFHAPSEHALMGKRFDLELHLVHKDQGGNLGVLGVLIKKGPRNDALQTVWDNLPKDSATEVKGPKFNCESLLPAERSYFRYSGSLTTPPCSEGVSWYVLQTPIAASEEQIRTFTTIFPNNSRPLQKRNGRAIISTL